MLIAAESFRSGRTAPLKLSFTRKIFYAILP